MGVYMLKRILSFVLCISILLCSIFIYVYTPVYASDVYNTIYTDFDYSSVISEHKSFTFTDKGGGKHPVIRVGSAWLTGLGSGQIISDDNDLNYYLSWYSYKGYNQKSDTGKGILSVINSKLGAIASFSSDLLSSVLLSVPDVDIDYNDSDGLTIASDSVDKLREQLKKQYYNSIGLVPFDVSNQSIPVDSRLFDEMDDYTSSYNLLMKYDYQFSFFANSDRLGGEQFDYFCFNRSDFNYAYLDTSNRSKLRFVDSDLKNIDLFKIILRVPTNKQDFACKDTLYFTASTKFSYSSYYYLLGVYDDTYNTWCTFLYSNKYNNFYVFKSYEALYNYVYGSQTAYLSSKVEQTGEDIKISIDDMNTNISDKMDELIDSINNGKGSMSADELQKAIDKGLSSLSGKMDDIKDNTQETNSKLDSLLTVMQSQNEILLNILGVTTDIYTVVSSKDDEQDKAYDINYVQAVFNTMFKGLKNAVLYGKNTVKQDVNQDTDDVNSLVTDVSPDNVNYRNGLFGKFPFSVPYQLFEWLQVLCVEPVAPSFTLSYDFLLKDFIDEENRDNFKLIIDLNDDKYKEWADLMRSGEKLAFTIYMAIATYNRFKNEV